jgi:hypothetical protein
MIRGTAEAPMRIVDRWWETQEWGMLPLIISWALAIGFVLFQASWIAP